jgi:biopolymer transport protein ExbD
MKRMSRSGGKKQASLNLVSLMDVFTILVFFLLVNSSSSDVLEPPKQITLPDSIVETKPRETVTVMVTKDQVLVQGIPVATLDELLASKVTVVESIREELIRQRERVIGVSTKVVAESKEVTLLADNNVPFKLLKKVMSSCTSAGYGKISLAVLQKASRE